jgi:hypothetical protein
MRIAIGQPWQETNSFNQLPTSRADFEQFGVLRGAESRRAGKAFIAPGGVLGPTAGVMTRHTVHLRRTSA